MPNIDDSHPFSATAGSRGRDDLGGSGDDSGGAGREDAVDEDNPDGEVGGDIRG
jgi:hypothetical protein